MVAGTLIAIYIRTLTKYFIVNNAYDLNSIQTELFLMKFCMIYPYTEIRTFI